MYGIECMCDVLPWSSCVRFCLCLLIMCDFMWPSEYVPLLWEISSRSVLMFECTLIIRKEGRAEERQTHTENKFHVEQFTHFSTWRWDRETFVIRSDKQKTVSQEIDHQFIFLFSFARTKIRTKYFDPQFIFSLRITYRMHYVPFLKKIQFYSCDVLQTNELRKFILFICNAVRASLFVSLDDLLRKKAYAA